MNAILDQCSQVACMAPLVLCIAAAPAAGPIS
jgi:hypothetical protein